MINEIIDDLREMTSCTIRELREKAGGRIITKVLGWEDKISGEEVPRKCCESCKYDYGFDKHCPVSIIPDLWNSKEDFCSRFEFKESEK